MTLRREDIHACRAVDDGLPNSLPRILSKEKIQ